MRSLDSLSLTDGAFELLKQLFLFVVDRGKVHREPTDFLERQHQLRKLLLLLLLICRLVFSVHVQDIIQ